MKIKIISTSVLFSVLFSSIIFAQDRTIVNASNSEISDNLDLRALASIFGEARNLDDFERQLNDPKIQISNLDLNNDNQVDYLRVIESVERNTHLIIVQSVLGRDMYQDVATIEVEKDRNNQIQVQVVGDVYMYGRNYIYEPIYVQTPLIYANFWVTNYHPYYSNWYWNYYPNYYYVWNPCPVFRYRNNINVYINFDNRYNYVNYRSCHRAIAVYDTQRENYCERNYPNNSFSYRNRNSINRYELDQNRTIRNVASRNELAYNSLRNTYPRENSMQKGEVNKTVYSSRENNYQNSKVNTRKDPTQIRENNEERAIYNSNRGSERNENYSPRNIPQSRNEPQRNYSEMRNETKKEYQQPRNESQRANSEMRSNQQSRNLSSSENNNRRNSRI